MWRGRARSGASGQSRRAVGRRRSARPAGLGPVRRAWPTTQLAPLIALEPPRPRPRGTTAGGPGAARPRRPSSTGGRGRWRRASGGAQLGPADPAGRPPAAAPAVGEPARQRAARRPPPTITTSKGRRGPSIDSTWGRMAADGRSRAGSRRLHQRRPPRRTTRWPRRCAGWTRPDSPSSADTEPWSDGPGGRYLVRDGTFAAWSAPSPPAGRRCGSLPRTPTRPTLRVKPNPDVGRRGLAAGRRRGLRRRAVELLARPRPRVRRAPRALRRHRRCRWTWPARCCACRSWRSTSTASVNQGLKLDAAAAPAADLGAGRARRGRPPGVPGRRGRCRRR